MKINKLRRPIVEIFRPMLSPILLACIVCQLLSPTAAFAQKSQKTSKSAEAKIAKLEAKVDELEAEYHQTCESAKDEMLDRITTFINYVENMPGLSVDVRLGVLKELREAKDATDSANSFTAIPAFQGIYQDFAKKIGSKYWPLIRELDKLRKELPTGDGRRDAVEKRVIKLSEHYTSFDSLKVGSKWTGFRSDLKMPPRLELDPAKIGQIGMFRKVQDNPVNIDFGLKIETRTGSNFTGVISQNDGRFQANVAGTYDGVSLTMRMVSMKKGAPRNFEYAGHLVGGCGCLGMQGFKTNKAFTVGTIFMTLK